MSTHTTTTSPNEPLRYEDVVGLKSRVSWGAIFAGTAVAASVYIVLTLLFTAIGLSMSEAGVQSGTMATGALILGVLSIVLSLFVGGWVTTQLTAGETMQEALIHGVLTWAMVTALTICTVSMGARTGYNAVLGASMVARTADPDANARNWEEAARAAGVPQSRIDELKQGLTPENIRHEVNNPENQEKARRGAMIATWVALAGTILSMAAAIGGSLVGAGPTLRLFPMAMRTERREVILTR